MKNKTSNTTHPTIKTITRMLEMRRIIHTKPYKQLTRKGITMQYLIFARNKDTLQKCVDHNYSNSPETEDNINKDNKHNQKM